MTLRELHAVFVNRYSAEKGSFHECGEQLAEAQGILFGCLCRGHSILVWFADRGVPDVARPKPRWAVSGTGLDDLTLAPSINLDVPYVDEAGVSHEASCKWHGHVRGGDVT